MIALIEIEALAAVESLTISGPVISSLTITPAGGGAILLAAVIGIFALYAMGHISLSDVSLSDVEKIFGEISVTPA